MVRHIASVERLWDTHFNKKNIKKSDVVQDIIFQTSFHKFLETSFVLILLERILMK